MKYDSLRKTKRNNRIIAYVQAHPELSYAEIAPRFDMTRAALKMVCLKRGLRRRERRDNGRN